MKIVYCILGTFNSGGMERVLANKTNFLVNNGYDVTIITTDQRDREPYFKLNNAVKCIDLGINYTDTLENGIFVKLFSFLKKQRKHRQLLQKELLKLKADIVISMFDHDVSFTYRINDGSRKILEIHFSRYKRLQYGRKGLMKFLDLYRSNQDLTLAQKYDKFIVLTEEDKEYWGELNNIEVIPNANSFSTCDVAKLDNRQVIAVGRYDYQKGFDDLIKAWSIVNEKFPDWILNIYGDGPLRTELENLILKMNLSNVVFLKKPVMDIQSVYLDHSILAMTSRYEGLPMVLLEAQSCGLPLVAYSCKCGPRDIISKNENGILVDEGDVVMFADSLMYLIENESDRKIKGVKSKGKSVVFQESTIMEKWDKLFKNLIAN